MYNIDIKNIIKDYLNYIISNNPEYICKDFLDFIETIMHLKDINIDYFKNFTVLKLNNLLAIK